MSAPILSQMQVSMGQDVQSATLQRVIAPVPRLPTSADHDITEILGPAS